MSGKSHAASLCIHTVCEQQLQPITTLLLQDVHDSSPSIQNRKNPSVSAVQSQPAVREKMKRVAHLPEESARNEMSFQLSQAVIRRSRDLSLTLMDG